MVSRKPVPSAASRSSEQSSSYTSTPAQPASSDYLPSATDASHERSPYSTTEDISNPWQDVQRPDISEGWEDTGQRHDEERVALSSKTQTTLPSEKTSSDFPAQIPEGFRQLTPQSSWEKDSEESDDGILESKQKAPNHAPPAPPAGPSPDPPTNMNNPFRARSSERIPQIPVARDDNASNIWAELAPSKAEPEAAPVPVAELRKLDLDDVPGWDSIPSKPMQPTPQTIDSPLIDLDNSEEYKQELEATPFGPAVGLEGLDPSASKGKAPKRNDTGDSYEPPSGPPPSKNPAAKYGDRKIAVSEEVANRQRNETYQIKHVRWADANSREIRTSPILIQNKNGPCPLMALVNALTLSTPPDSNTALVETLRVREQISLGLLLDAVFDELMSGRRGNAAQGLPDVTELYAFLITLHTGMNVNPCFISARSQQQNLLDELGDEAGFLPQEFHTAGTFEDTKEMMLYGTFSIPLIHGWLPPRDHPAYTALGRSATTYEDAQNLMFREEELEDKVQNSGLSPQEQQLLEDISSVKYFLSSTATQLTGHGLEKMNEALKPGAIAILFRNDHFSTLYKQPRTGQLLSLVTDAGYSSHDEIVWESLVDVSGEGSEFYSGDFRVVGGNPSQSQAFEQNAASAGEWTTVQRGKGQRGTRGALSEQSVPHGSNEMSGHSGRDHEQEDADLALALQLQEEEEENSRRTGAERRRQEEAASTGYLASQGGSPSDTRNSPNQRRQSRSTSQNIQPLLPPRRNTAQANSRPAVHRETADDDAPPTYEQASKAEPYSGPDPLAQSTSHASGSSRPVGRPRGQSAYSENSQYPSSPAHGRRRSGIPSPLDAPIGVTTRRPMTNDRDKDCIIM